MRLLWRRFAGLLLSLSLLWLFTSQALAYVFTPIPEYGRVQMWKRSKFPVLMDLLSTGTPDLPLADVQQALNASAKSWNAVNCTLARIQIRSLVSSAKLPGFDGINVVAFINKKADWPGVDGQFALTIVTYSKPMGEIVDADILLNDWNFTFGVKGESTKADLQATLTHEMGHVFGLGHSKDPKASMYFQANVGETSKRKVADDDSKGICDLYPKNSCKEGEVVDSKRVCYNGRLAPICAPYHQVCQRCVTNDDCRGKLNFCIGINGGVCGFDCSGGKTCPQGYTCRPVQDAKKVTIGANCVPDGNSCNTAPAFPCCRNNNDCAPSFTCINGDCRRQDICVKEGDACQKAGTCCGSNQCYKGNAGSFCRQPCDPLSPRCNGTLRCKHTNTRFSAGVCVPPKGGGKEGDTCKTDDDCEYEYGCNPQDKRCYLRCSVGRQSSCPNNYRCLEIDAANKVGVCLKETGDVACKTLSDCPLGKVCRNQRCSSCTKDNECPARYKCLSGFCRSSCEADSDCPRQHRCVSASCQPGISCTQNGDCTKGQICKGQICVTPGNKQCAKDGDCGSGQKCINQQCQLADACNNRCKDDQVCLNGTCLPRVCSSDQQCGQGFVCRNSVCRTQEDNCGGQGRCPSGKECVAGRCLTLLGYPCRGDEECSSRLCAKAGEDSLCSQSCLSSDTKSCPSNFFCTELPNIGSGCWPSTKSECKDGLCKPKGQGCSCESVPPPTEFFVELFILLAFFLLLLRQRTRRVS